LILLGWAAALRRVDLTVLRWKHLTDVDQGIILFLPYSKTDRVGHGREIGIPYGTNTWSCPVTAVQEWRDYVAAQVDDLADHPVFVPLGRSGAIMDRPISTAAISAILERRARLAGLEGRYGGRSLRSGLITSASEAGASLEEIQSISGHRDLASLARYIDRSDPFRRNAARTAGL
jgi:integrase